MSHGCNDADAVKYVPLTAQQRFTALQSGEVDLLSRNTTWTLTRDAALGVNFAGVTFYDGQGFMVPEAGVTSALDLDGASVCVPQGTTTELNLADFFRAHGLSYELVAFERLDAVSAAFFAGRCDAVTTDASALAAIRAEFADDPHDYVILPQPISKEPLGPVVRHGDDRFFDVVKWVVYALIEAEERGVTANNVDALAADADDPVVARLLGVEPGTGEALGLSEEWARRAIKAVGNYGEIFARNLGPQTPLGLERGLNDQWTRGGLLYAMPVR